MKYELFFSERGIGLGISVGTVYEVCHDYYHDTMGVKLYNLVYAPRTGKMIYRSDVHFPKELVNYWESLELSRVIFSDESHFNSRKDVFRELEEFGILPIRDSERVIDSYYDLKDNKSNIKQRRKVLSDMIQRTSKK